MRSFLIVSALCVLGSCRAQDRTPAAESTNAERQSSAVLGSTATPQRQASSPPNDHAVYVAVLREHFMPPKRGEHGLLCEPEAPGGALAIVGTTQPLPPGTPARDSAWANELPPPAAPLMTVLRALDREPSRALDADSLAVGVPIRLVPDSLAARALQAVTRPAAGSAPSAAPLFWVSRVAYSAGGEWALVYAVAVCPGVTQSMMADAENGAYERVLLAPMERRGDVWMSHPPVFLDIGLPRLELR